MREIEFRGKRIDNGQFVYGGFYQWDDKSYIIQKDFWDKNLLLAHMVEVIPETVGEYTGLKDKNGVKIFEGDIVQTRNLDGETNNYEVLFKTETGRFMAENPNEIYDVIASHFPNTEVVGTIHDNPELLKEAAR
ncbi:MAG: YopX family protein [Tannerella sp.]|jgi:uncharacterized phage protein (TIGR01671 family)|nr:YopX family protein [Tannerella sp.]